MQRSTSDFLRKSGSLLAKVRVRPGVAAVDRGYELHAKLTLMRVENVRSAGCIHATFEGSNTGSALVDEMTGTALFPNTLLETRVTVYKRSVEDSTRFKARLVRLFVKACGATSNPPVIAAIAFDLASYAQVGPKPRCVRLELSHGVLVVGLLSCSIRHAASVVSGSRLDRSKNNRAYESMGTASMARAGRGFSFCSRRPIRYSIDRQEQDWKGYELSECNRDQLVTENRRLKLVLDSTMSRVKVSQSNLMVQNAILRRQIKRLENTLEREPKVSDVINELHQVRQALAIVTTERNKLQENLKAQRGMAWISR